jgi:hypothetical protein
MKKITTLLSIIILIIACRHTILTNDTVVVVGGGTGGGGTGVTGDTVCFQNDVLPLFVGYCASAGCHNSITRADGVQLTDYTTIKRGIVPYNASSSKYYKEIVNGKMPPNGSPKLNATQIALIQKWITQGANNTICNNNCDTSKYTYNTAIQTIFSNNCNGCHGNAPGSGGVYLGTYAASQTYIAANKTLFLNAINHSTTLPAAQRMPIGTKMDSCKINTITKWINAGMPQ